MGICPTKVQSTTSHLVSTIHHIYHAQCVGFLMIQSFSTVGGLCEGDITGHQPSSVHRRHRLLDRTSVRSDLRGPRPLACTCSGMVGPLATLGNITMVHAKRHAFAGRVGRDELGGPSLRPKMADTSSIAAGSPPKRNGQRKGPHREAHQ